MLPQSTTVSTPRLNNLSNERLELYKSLFGHNANKGCDESGLHLTQSLNYSLYTFLHLCDSDWVLAMFDIDDFDKTITKYGQQGADRKLIQIGKVIYNFCEN